MRLSGRDDPVEQRPLVLRRDPQLVAQLAGVVDPGDEGGLHPEVDAAERHERERGGRQVEIRCDGGEDVARPRPGQRQTDEGQAEDLERHRPVARQVVAEPARVVGLGRERAEQVKLVGRGGPGDGELADDPPGVVEHRGERDPSLRGHSGGEQR